MKRSLLFSILVSCTLVLAVGSFSYGATIDHKTEQSSYVADLSDNNTSVFAFIALATPVEYFDMTPALPYAGEVKAYSNLSLNKRTSLYRTARDGIS